LGEIGRRGMWGDKVVRYFDRRIFEKGKRKVGG
jgi:hypothetical protein